MPMQYGAYGIKCTTANCCDLETQIESAPLLSGGLSSCGPHDNAQFRREQNWLDIIGVSGEATGTGAVVAIIDNGIAPTHPDLVGRVSTTRKDTNGQTYAQAALQPQPEWQGWPNEYLDVATSRHGKERVYRTTYPHGTAVGGIIGASGATYIRGVAPDVTLLDCNCANPSNGYQFIKLDWGIDFVDVYNNSWGPHLLPAACYDACSQIEKGTTHGRAGLGCLYVFSAGNGYDSGANANLEGTLNWHSTVVVAARNINTSVKSFYSTLGANVLVAGVGANDLNESVGVVTAGPYPVAPVNLEMNGTSAAAPMVSGVIAVVIAQAKKLGKQLHWYDVKEILCACAQPSIAVASMRASGPFATEAEALIETTNVSKQDLLKRVPQKGKGIPDRLYSTGYGYGTVSLRRALEVLETYEAAPSAVKQTESVLSYPKTIAKCATHVESGFANIQHLDIATNMVANFLDPLSSVDPGFRATIDEVLITIYGAGGTEGLQVNDVGTLTKLGICLILGENIAGAQKPFAYHSSWILSCSEERAVGTNELYVPSGGRLNTQFKSEAFRGTPHTRGQGWAICAGNFHYAPGSALPSIIVQSCRITIRYRVPAN